MENSSPNTPFYKIDSKIHELSIGIKDKKVTDADILSLSLSESARKPKLTSRVFTEIKAHPLVEKVLFQDNEADNIAHAPIEVEIEVAQNVEIEKSEDFTDMLLHNNDDYSDDDDNNNEENGVRAMIDKDFLRLQLKEKVASAIEYQLFSILKNGTYEEVSVFLINEYVIQTFI